MRQETTPAVTISSPTPSGGPDRAPHGGWNLTPGSVLTETQRDWVEDTLARLSLRDRIGQMMMPWLLADYSHWDGRAFADARRWVVEDKIGGILWSLGSPVELADKANALQRLAPVPLIMGCDLEPGLGRLKGGVVLPSIMPMGGGTPIPSQMAIGATGDPALAYAAGRIIGREARAVGIQIAFAPSVDVNSDPNNPAINIRSFGEHPRAVAALASAMIRGIQDEGAVATPKHFPGHGNTAVDSHHALPIVRSDVAHLHRVELAPFRAAICAGAGAVMTGHVAVPAIGSSNVPATLDPAVTTDLLRGVLGFRGLTITDALSMGGIRGGYDVATSAVLAVRAGADILLAPDDVRGAIAAVHDSVDSGEISHERIARSARAILELKARTGVAFEPVVSLDSLRRVVGAPDHWTVSRRIAARAVTLLRDQQRLVPLTSALPVTVVTYAPETELEAGRIFAAVLGAGPHAARVTRIGPDVGQARLNSIAQAMDVDGVVVVTTHVRVVEGEGRPAIPTHVAEWIDALAASRLTIVVAHGNPYVLRQFPRVGTYMVTYGIDPSLERAAADALRGRQPIVGRVPVSLPGFFHVGDGIQRSLG